MKTISITDILNYFLFLDAESLIRYGGLLIICLIVYTNIGLFFCFFLPSGAVLFTAGVLIATGSLQHDIFTVCFVLISSAALGSITGYWFGLRAGPVLYRREDSRFFRRQYLISTEAFYKKHGALTSSPGIFYLSFALSLPLLAV